MKKVEDGAVPEVSEKLLNKISTEILTIMIKQRCAFLKMGIPPNVLFKNISELYPKINSSHIIGKELISKNASTIKENIVFVSGYESLSAEDQIKFETKVRELVANLKKKIIILSTTLPDISIFDIDRPFYGHRELPCDQFFEIDIKSPNEFNIVQYKYLLRINQAEFAQVNTKKFTV